MPSPPSAGLGCSEAVPPAERWGFDQPCFWGFGRSFPSWRWAFESFDLAVLILKPTRGVGLITSNWTCIPTSCDALGRSLAVVHARHATLVHVTHGDGVGWGGADNVQFNLYSLKMLKMLLRWRCWRCCYFDDVAMLKMLLRWRCWRCWRCCYVEDVEDVATLMMLLCWRCCYDEDVEDVAALKMLKRLLHWRCC